MANLSQILERIRSEASAGNNDAVQTLIAEAISADRDNMDEVQQLRSEAKRRREKADQLAAKLADMEDTAAAFERDKAEIARLKKVEAELLNIRKTEADKVVRAWTDKAQIFAIPDTDKRHAKVNAVRDRFTFGSDDAPLTPEQAAANLDKLELLEASGAFAIPVDTTPNVTPPSPNYQAPPVNPFAGKFKK